LPRSSDDEKGSVDGNADSGEDRDSSDEEVWPWFPLFQESDQSAATQTPLPLLEAPAAPAPQQKQSQMPLPPKPANYDLLAKQWALKKKGKVSL
jgi:hypothetical protein